MNLVSAFAASTDKHPEKSALFRGDSIFSYRDLWDQSVLICDQLQSRFGLKRGDRVGLWLKNCPEFVPTLFAILNAGAVAVPINSFLKPDEVNYILSDAGIDLLVTDAELATHFPSLKSARPGLQLFQTSEMKAGSGISKGAASLTGKGAATLTESDLAVLIYTSGTTGR